MRDYVKELMEAWSEHGEQAAYITGGRLLQDLRRDISRLEKQELAILALGAVFFEDPDVDTSQDPGYFPTELETVDPLERPKVIVNAAKQAYQERERNPWSSTGTAEIKSQDVIDHLRSQGLSLGVQQPLAVIGTVLSSASEFRKVARNSFLYQGEPTTPVSFRPEDLEDDLPF